MAHILIVEDEKRLLEMYRDKFKFSGFDVSIADNGEDGLRIALDEQPDVVLLDILLPKKKGTEVLKEIREANQWGEAVPIIMLTNLDSNDEILDTISTYGPSYYLIKSNTELNDILEKVKNLVD